MCIYCRLCWRSMYGETVRQRKRRRTQRKENAAGWRSRSHLRLPRSACKYSQAADVTGAGLPSREARKRRDSGAKGVRQSFLIVRSWSAGLQPSAACVPLSSSCIKPPAPPAEVWNRDGSLYNGRAAFRRYELRRRVWLAGPPAPG